MMQQENTETIAVQQMDETELIATDRSVTTEKANRFSSSITPIAALCCLGFVLLLIAAAIVLSLLPVYLTQRDITVAKSSETYTFDIQLGNGLALSVGEYNAEQRAVVQTALQNQLNSNPTTKTSTITVTSATGIASVKRRKRQSQTLATFVRVVAILEYLSSVRVRNVFISILNKFVLTTSEAQQIESLKTVTNNTVTNGTRILSRRSLYEGGAPAGIVYIDSHKIAAKKGNITSVSFYIDQTCALSTVEFGAFNLINRDLEHNLAQLFLTETSGSLKLGAIKEIKPYMHLITIQLCSGNATNNANTGNCQGTQFPILPHQYLGIRSDKCRLGYAPTPTDRVLATTWEPENGLDAFAKRYQQLNYLPSAYTILQSVTIDSLESNTKTSIEGQKSMINTIPRVLFLGTYPPRKCGLATFLADLTENYPGPYDVIAVDEPTVDESSRNYTDKVIFRLNQTNSDSYYTVGDIVNSGAYDVFNLQHEFGLFGGMYGEYVIKLLASIRKPVITTLHTIISKPNSFLMSVMRSICATSSRVVVLSNGGRQLLIDVYGVDEKKISVIRHGVPDSKFSHSLADAKVSLGFEENIPTMATFGLLHRDKYIQLPLQALQTVVKSIPNVMYLIIGQTHPLVQVSEGNSYVHELEHNITALGLTKNVRFIDKYMNDDELTAYLGAVDIVLTPYNSVDQYVSGALSWAVGAGKCVISTPYPYAKELLDNGRGFLTPYDDAEHLSSLIIKLFQDTKVRDRARRNAYDFGRNMIWPIIGAKFEEISRDLISSA
ncbi:unnamed protein product [Rotaria magnacalcarata]|uniref:Glycosyltransferase n=4 Tax=Rotaria magnacalcarata TaxID=392030 RepID=A0A819KPZ3_9BILA|nr:unnamed protein product [Rotaria magnacalcarata]CAF3948565.1 unnamed protein product [Rotaria magnacalcarata]